MQDLGVVFDQYLIFHDHISGITTHFHLRGIGRIWNLQTFDATAQRIHALITSRLDFCSIILYNLTNKQIERLQRIQNQAARMLKRIPRRNHITPVLTELHWLRIHDKIIFKILLLTHTAVNNTAPEYLCDLIKLNVKSTTICTRESFDPCLFCVPPISKTCANSFCDRSFVYAAPTLWNAKDFDIRILPFDTFKKSVKTHLYLPLGAILRHHNIGYQITRMTPNSTFHFINFIHPLESLAKLNMCISDIRVWMIKNKLKINDSKT